jgi:hypothetical protein
VIQLIIVVIGVIFLIGVLLAIFRRELFNYYIIGISLLFAIPVGAVYLIYRVLLGIGNLLFVALKMFIKSISKTIVILLTMIPSTLAIFSTTGLPHLGEKILRLDEIIFNSTDFGLIDNLEFARATMIEIIVDEEEIETQYSSIEPYRDKFDKIKNQGVKMLSAGDTILSVSIGGLLLILQVYKLGIFQIGIYGYTAAVVIQIGLFILTFSILYRAFILDFLAFDGNEEFESVEEADVALSYQQAVSRIAVVQSFTILILFALRVSNVDKRIVKSTLRFYYRDDTSFIETMQFAWRKLRDHESE